MTKEEAIKILNGYMCGKIDPESSELYQAIALVVDILEFQPSLPSNLDKAAVAYANSIAQDGSKKVYCMDDFKAGAERMAGQSQKIDGDLEKEAEAYWKAQGGGSHAQWDKFRAVVKHFTNWQKEHIIEVLLQ